MINFLTISSIISIFIIYIIFWFNPTFSIYSLLAVRASIGFLRDLKISFLGYELSFLGIFSLFVCFLGIIYILVKKANIKNNFFIFYTLFCVWCLISIGYSIDKHASIPDFLRVFSPIMFYILIFNEIKQKTHINNLIWVIILSCLVPIFYGFYQYITHTGFIKHGILRINSTFMYPNLFGAYLYLIALMTVNQIVLTKKRIIKIFLFFILGITLFSLILTGTRTSFVSFLIGFIIYIFLTSRKRYIFFVLPIICLALLTQSTIRERLFQPFESSLTLHKKHSEYITIKSNVLNKRERFKGNTWKWRTWYWKQVLKTYFRKPILGYGIGTSILAVQKTLHINANYPHNDYLRLLLEVGIFGFFLYIISFGVLLHDFIHFFLNSMNREYKSCYAVSIAIIISFLAMIIASNRITANTLLWYFFAIIAITYSIRNNEIVEKV